MTPTKRSPRSTQHRSSPKSRPLPTAEVPAAPPEKRRAAGAAGEVVREQPRVDAQRLVRRAVAAAGAAAVRLAPLSSSARRASRPTSQRALAASSVDRDPTQRDFQLTPARESTP